MNVDACLDSHKKWYVAFAAITSSTLVVAGVASLIFAGIPHDQSLTVYTFKMIWSVVSLIMGLFLTVAVIYRGSVPTISSPASFV